MNNFAKQRLPCLALLAIAISAASFSTIAYAESRLLIETDPQGSYCYLTMAFQADTLHLAYYGPGGLRYQTIPRKSLLTSSSQ